MSACGGGSSDKPDESGPDKSEVCEKDDDCEDGLFCNGEESCDPEDEDADEDGCVAGKERTCNDGIDCTEDSCSDRRGECVNEAPDEDGDGHGDRECEDENGDRLGDDCDDSDSNRYPGNPEVCDDDGHDEDCDDKTYGDRDEDGDGSVSDQCCNLSDNGKICGPDCDDNDLARNPRQVEFCDKKDNDCDGKVDEERNIVSWYPDEDGDLFGAVGDAAEESCEIVPGHSILAKDCNDEDDAQNPITVEQCDDDIDNNCNGFIDEGAMSKEPEGRPVEEMSSDPEDCGDVEHGKEQTRTRYEAEEVPFGDECVSEEQSRECDDGEFTDWSGDFEETSCEELPSESCGDFANGETETRTFYETESVPHGDTCVSEERMRTCVDGEFSAWDGSFPFTSCTIDEPSSNSCGSTPHGDTEARTRYESATVPFGEECVSEEQTRTCDNGSFGGWDGSYTAEECGLTFDGTPMTYIKASDPQAGDLFGIHALSRDQTTLVVSATHRGSSQGAAYVFTRQGGIWVEQDYLIGSNGSPGDEFGRSIAISADGSTIVVGAPRDGSGDVGAVYVFKRESDGTWLEDERIAPLDTSNTDAALGYHVTINGSGDRLAAGAFNTGATGPSPRTGIVFVYDRNGSSWEQDALIASETTTDDRFGISVLLSNGGDLLAVGADLEDSSSSGVNSVPNDSATNAGAAYVYHRQEEGDWQKEAYLKALYPDSEDRFGRRLAFNDEANVLAVSAHQEDSSAAGVDSVPNVDGSATQSGAAYVYRFDGLEWQVDAYLKAFNAHEDAFFGDFLSLSGSGNLLAVTATWENSSTVGINSTPDQLAPKSGAGYLFHYADSAWSQIAYVKSPSTRADDRLFPMTVSNDGQLAVLGARYEDSSSSGINSTPVFDPSVEDSGAVYIYDLSEALP